MLSLKCFIGSSVLATAALLSITPAAAEDWSGFYLGVHGGGAWSPSSYDHVETLGVGGSEDNREFFSTDGSSVAGGFQAGVQQQFDQFVLGVEGFYTLLDAKDSSQTDLNGIPRTRETRLNDYWGAAARVGYNLDNAMPYLKVGYAGTTLDYVNTRIADNVVVGESSNKVGGVLLGAGVDFALTKNWTVGADYSFTKFNVGSQQQTRDGAAVAAYNDDNDVKLHLVTIRLNYKF
ncbi:outer membrane protein [Shinella zoogloeoides]|uniref:Outer membrane beta-barrel protein n=1 Tax=Shinella zoogloeoides TaxID=352475 RepID=A0A6N8T8C8_SHIZO|nr:outer membrane beta-barrel protein [Shinella zoogloeoides]MXN99531.1 outer membrane beta-barrel protein [Shinella zoogloeoides]UEX82692.1 outer membrane beta-barrel protein [Shinella zoogloeoides]